MPCIGHWLEEVTVAATVTHVDLLFPPIASKLRGMFEDMDVDMDGKLSAREIEISWDTTPGLDEIFDELLTKCHAVVRIDPHAGDPYEYMYLPVDAPDLSEHGQERVRLEEGLLMTILSQQPDPKEVLLCIPVRFQ